MATGAVLSAGILLASGCAAQTAPAGQTPSSMPPVTAPATVSNPLAGCQPLPKPTGSEGAAVDYVDFVQQHGVTYVANVDQTQVLTADDAGPAAFTVRCALGNLNTATHQLPPPARDGDSSYLPSGTVVYELRGWPESCRLLAQATGGWVSYVAKAKDGTPLPCQPSTPPPRAAEPTAAVMSGSFGRCHSRALPPGETSGQGDFIEFIVYGGQIYVGGLGGGHDPGHGKVILHVACNFGSFSDSLAGSTTGAVQANGDAAFLPAGTPVYAVTGIPSQCELTAHSDDGWHVYSAHGPGCPTAAPIATALPSHS